MQLSVTHWQDTAWGVHSKKLPCGVYTCVRVQGRRPPPRTKIGGEGAVIFRVHISPELDRTDLWWEAGGGAIYISMTDLSITTFHHPTSGVIIALLFFCC